MIFLFFFSLSSLYLWLTSLSFSHFLSHRSTLSPTHAVDLSPIADLLGFFFFFLICQLLGFFFFWFFPIANLLVSGYFSVVVGYFYWVVWVPIGHWCRSCCTVASDWLLVSILCGFRLFRWWLCGCFGCFRSVSDDRVWVVLGLWERWHC